MHGASGGGQPCLDGQGRNDEEAAAVWAVLNHIDYIATLSDLILGIEPRARCVLSMTSVTHDTPQHATE